MSAANSLVGHQLGSVLIALDHIVLHFAKYPLTSTSQFAQTAVLGIDEGFLMSTPTDTCEVRKGDDLAGFRRVGSSLVGLVSCIVTGEQHLPSGELRLHFDDRSSLRLLVNEYGFDSFELSFSK